MINKEFRTIRRQFQKTQKQMSEVLGTSLKAIQSFEQGWRKIPVYIERQMFFLMAMKNGAGKKRQACWQIRDCPVSARKSCPAWEFNLGNLCWFINGTVCRGKPQDSWAKKMKICRRCEVFLQTAN